ncbi:hypothetical protein GCM10010435_62430 [Winogradskya consettensis]|uniref:Uncharacterized protein n=1 Tax=Winogradskya consettensis TaxID=113560 RepID=A0A919T1R9_9ACTN|nr:hypothetical protein [Actinoplanes consettensis]GIM83165.1 hypothetical protein Aco04nite_85150 [Actinoplanes consettensis]
MEEALSAYGDGRVDGFVGQRDPARAEHPVTGVDYRRGFLDGRVEVFQMMAGVRRLLEADD